ncbi:MAG: hypothetical protein SFV19_13615 [Rhodospirillaceae bacterium]|nr:hypothetical protein [Rhodospirillaceae bacterium]
MSSATPPPPDPDEVARQRDAMHILPLSTMPVEHPFLKRALMVKSARLESVVELYKDVGGAGSGQKDIDGVCRDFFGGKFTHPDIILLNKLATLNSYDVYSLRILLRANDISVNDKDALKLSPAKTKELSGYMKSFTRPLLMQVYGSEANIESFDDVVKLFRDPDIKKAREKLNIMAEKLGIEIVAIPKFLEDYADIFMSLSYYRECLDSIQPIIENFLSELKDLKKNFQLKNNAIFMNTAHQMENIFTNIVASIGGRFENFDRNTKDMWNNISAEKFRKVEAMITAYHTTIGGVLCAMTVKVDAWQKNFPRRNVGSPPKKAEFIMSDMRHGLEKMIAIEKAAPKLAAIN